MFEFQSKHYEPATDDLFLVYTAIDNSFNKNGWKVEDIDKNITSGLGRPGVIKPKDPTSLLDQKQEGNFVHPEFPNASLVELLQGQEAYSIARAVRLDKPQPGSDWRVWLQITDPKAKLALKNASAAGDHAILYPKYISPQVITFPSDFPDEDKANSYKHWIISHWAFVDVPAYGEKMQIRGNCYGDLNNCKIKLQNASTAGFCITGAIKALSSSSHNANSTTQNIMSSDQNAGSNNGSPINSNSQQIPNTGPVYSWQPVQISTSPTPTNNVTIPSKQEAEPESDQKPGLEKGDKQIRDGPPDKEEPKARISGLPESVPELQNMVATLQEAMRGLQKDFAAIKKDNDIRKQTEQRYYAASKVARYGSQFKSKDAFEKEVDVALRYSSVMSEQELEQYLADKFGKTTTIAPVAKSAAAIIADTNHDVPDFQANNASAGSSDNNRKFIEVMDMFETGVA
jgi:hypothetical protein